MFCRAQARSRRESRRGCPASEASAHAQAKHTALDVPVSSPLLKRSMSVERRAPRVASATPFISPARKCGVGERKKKPSPRRGRHPSTSPAHYRAVAKAIRIFRTQNPEIKSSAHPTITNKVPAGVDPTLASEIPLPSKQPLMNSTREPSIPDCIPPVNHPDSYQSKSPRRPISIPPQKNRRPAKAANPITEN